MSPRRISKIEPGRQFKPISSRGCLWCNCSQRPVYHTSEVNGVISYTGGICSSCVRYFKVELCSARWIKARRVHLLTYPYCIHCMASELNISVDETRRLSLEEVAEFNKSHLMPATVLDHIFPWRYFPDLFWNQEYWQGLCEPCHRIKTRQERF